MQLWQISLLHEFIPDNLNLGALIQIISTSNCPG